VVAGAGRGGCRLLVPPGRGSRWPAAAAATGLLPAAAEGVAQQRWRLPPAAGLVTSRAWLLLLLLLPLLKCSSVESSSDALFIRTATWLRVTG